MEWYQGIEKIQNCVVKVITPYGHGTGFLVGSSKGYRMLATAAHVVRHANDWQEPIKIQHAVTKKRFFSVTIIDMLTLILHEILL